MKRINFRWVEWVIVIKLILYIHQQDLGAQWFIFFAKPLAGLVSLLFHCIP